MFSRLFKTVPSDSADEKYPVFTTHIALPDILPEGSYTALQEVIFMTEEDQQAIALARYAAIAPLVTEQTGEL